MIVNESEVKTVVNATRKFFALHSNFRSLPKTDEEWEDD